MKMRTKRRNERRKKKKRRRRRKEGEVKIQDKVKKIRVYKTKGRGGKEREEKSVKEEEGIERERGGTGVKEEGERE